jgi:hypothetical protein
MNWVKNMAKKLQATSKRLVSCEGGNLSREMYVIHMLYSLYIKIFNNVACYIFYFVTS